MTSAATLAAEIEALAGNRMLGVSIGVRVDDLMRVAASVRELRELGECGTCKALDDMLTEAETLTLTRECDGHVSIRWGPEDDAISFGTTLSAAVAAAGKQHKEKS